MTRSIKQQWQSERKWELHGSLAGIQYRLQQLTNYYSILPEEKSQLLEAVKIVAKIAKDCRHKFTDKDSFNQFKERKGYAKT